jgi:hypothetical protein
MEKKIVGTVGLHISNSGVSISIIDEGFGPTIEITSSAFGNIQHSFKILTDVNALKKLSNLFGEATNFFFSKDYVCKAYITK